MSGVTGTTPSATPGESGAAGSLTDRGRTPPAESLTGKAARGGLAIMGGHICLTACGYVIAVVLARGLGPAEYGVYGVVYSVLLGLELIGRLGVPQAVSKLVAERRDDPTPLEATGVTLTVIIFAILFAGFWGAAPLMASTFNVPDGTRLFRIAALDIPIYGLYFIANHILNGRRRFGAESISHCVYGVSKALGILLLLYLGLSVERALIVNIAGSVVALGYAGWRVGRRAFSITLLHWRPIVALAVPIGLYIMGLQLVLNLDLWLLNALGLTVSEETKGIYVGALNVARMPKIVGWVLTAVLIPSVARALALGDRDVVRRSVRGTARFLALFLLPACVLLAADGEPVMRLLFSGRFGGEAWTVATLVISQGLFHTVLMAQGAVLIAAGRARTAAAINLLLVLPALAAGWALIPTLGAIGAALSSLVATAAGVVAGGFLIHRDVARLTVGADLVKALLATAALGLAAAWLPLEGLALLAELLLLGFLFVLGLFGLRLASWKDVMLFLPVRGGRPVNEASP